MKNKFKKSLASLVLGISGITGLVGNVNADVVVLDPGHGYNNRKPGVYDPGAKYKIEEADYVFEEAKKIGENLQKNGIKVAYTRTFQKDKSIPNMNKYSLPLKDRPKTANNLKKRFPNEPIIYVSLHCNASSNKNAEGFRIYSKDNKNSKELRNTIYNSLHNELKMVGYNQNYDGKKTANFWVLKKSELPAVLIESGFLTNKEDLKRLINHRKSYTEGISKGIMKYLAKLHKH